MTTTNSRNPYEDLNNHKNVAGKNIHHYRIELGMSAQKLSDQLLLLGLDIHTSAIYRIESGERTITDYELALFSKILKVTPNDLLKTFLDSIN